MFMQNKKKKVIIAVGLIIVQAIIYAIFAGRSHHFTIATFFIASLPGIIGALIIWIEKNKGRF